MEVIRERVGATLRTEELRGWSELEWSPDEFDELTDCAERIRAPLDHQLYFDLRDGDLCCNTASDGMGLLQVAEVSLRAAIEAVKYDSRWAVEALRRRIEYDEIKQVMEMPDGQMLILSPTPDAVIEGSWDFGIGYNLTKKSVMMRLWKRAGDEFACRYVSLAGGNKDGLVAGLENLGESLPERNGSEDWLRGRWYFPVDVDVASVMIGSYDDDMREKFGGKWTYGMEEMSEASALAIVCRWQDLLEEHMSRLARAESAAEEERLRYDYAAAVEARRGGDFAMTMDAAGDAARAEGVDFSGYCETIEVTNNLGAMRELGLRRNVLMHCPYCGAAVYGDPCMPGTCPTCGSAPGRSAGEKFFEEKKLEKSVESETSDLDGAATKKEILPERKEDENGLRVEEILESNWRVVRGGILNEIEALVDKHGEVLAVGLRAKKIEYLRQDKERIWLKIA